MVLVDGSARTVVHCPAERRNSRSALLNSLTAGIAPQLGEYLEAQALAGFFSFENRFSWLS